ncbi:hypothetical protein ACIQUL_29515 [Streptomyces sp. NPDC090303]|uniref:hypothetical protein n=1 Tax=Streptomyces sp. NPDC090303 TaxID=3365960 RepID=UPI00382BBB79
MTEKHNEVVAGGPARTVSEAGAAVTSSVADLAAGVDASKRHDHIARFVLDGVEAAGLDPTAFAQAVAKAAHGRSGVAVHGDGPAVEGPAAAE